VIWLRPWKELILRTLRRGSGGRLRGFLRLFSRNYQAKMAARDCENRVAVRRETGVSRGWKNVKSGSNFLYPAVLLTTSKEVSPRFAAPWVGLLVGPKARRTRFQDENEENQCQPL
jgi:hypothetical protein